MLLCLERLMARRFVRPGRVGLNFARISQRLRVTVRQPETHDMTAEQPCKTVKTELLEIAYSELNPAGLRTAVLMHGWPDSPRTWHRVAADMADAGYRVLTPALRGFGATRFLSPDTPRSGQLSALGRDLLGFIDALDLQRPVLVGHDWGARAVANACGLRAGAASHLVMISVGYGTNDPNQKLTIDQSRRYWYHWFMATERGARFVREEGKAFAREMWDTWSPAGWYDSADFDETARAFDNPDWAAIVLHSYRQRWGHAPAYAEYADDDARLNPAPLLDVPTLVIHGGSDLCSLPEMSAGKEKFFSNRYERVVIDGVGHFPQKENPRRVADEILNFCKTP